MMTMESFESFRQCADEQGVIFYFEGEFTENVIVTMGESIRRTLDADPGAIKKRRKIFSTFIEMAQNVAHYASETDADLPAEERTEGRTGTLSVGKQGEMYFIMSSNAILSRHVDRLRAKLEALTGMSGEEIRHAYKAQLHNDAHADDPVSKGAGLGLLTIARDASQPIEYVFTHGMNGSLTHFFMRAVV